MIKVVGISGWKKSGKDTAASFLVNEYDFKQVSFANPLKDMTSECYEINRTDCDDQDKKESPILSKPVNPQDLFSKMICSFMYKEFRFANGEQPVDFYNENDGFWGVYGRDLKQLYWTPRALLILEGSAKRTVSSSFWVDKLTQNIKKTNNGLFVISDLRYKSELNQLKEAFGENFVSIRINRFETNSSTDPSENDLNDAQFDYTISNIGNLAFFKERVGVTVTEILKGKKD